MQIDNSSLIIIYVISAVIVTLSETIKLESTLKDIHKHNSKMAANDIGIAICIGAILLAITPVVNTFFAIASILNIFQKD